MIFPCRFCWSSPFGSWLIRLYKDLVWWVSKFEDKTHIPLSLDLCILLSFGLCIGSYILDPKTLYMLRGVTWRGVISTLLCYFEIVFIIVIPYSLFRICLYFHISLLSLIIFKPMTCHIYCEAYVRDFWVPYTLCPS